MIEYWDLLLPDGYGAGDDLFADPSSWSGDKADELESHDEEDGKGDGAEDAPTTAQETAQDVTGNDNAEAPTTEPTAVPTTQPPEPTAHELFAEAAEVNEQSEPVLQPDRHPSTETLLWAKILPVKFREVSASVLKIFL